MKKSLLIIASIFLLTPSLVLAESDENVTKRRPDSETAVQIQEIKTNLQEMRDNVAARHANRLERRFNFYYTRLSNILLRFQKRLDTLKADGKDVTTIQQKLDATKAKLEEAKTKGMEAVAAFKAIDPAKFSEQKTAAFAARDLANAARKLFADTLVLLKDALKALKVVSKPALPAASAAVEKTL